MKGLNTKKRRHKGQEERELLQEYYRVHDQEGSCETWRNTIDEEKF